MQMLPPNGQIDNFLPSADHDRLLAYALANEARFAPATIKRPDAGDAVRPTVRSNLTLRDLGPDSEPLRARFLAALPEVMRLAGANGPEPRSLELELTAYGEGAFYGPHLDIPVGAGRRPLGAAPGEDRLISAVYYFHRSPKGFSGGGLRLFPFGSGEAAAAAVEIEPTDNRLAVFPSWAKHEVLPVRCPSGAFADSRFAINCWYCRALGQVRDPSVR